MSPRFARALTSLALLCAGALAGPPTAAAAHREVEQIHVAPGGRDRGPGTRSDPLATLTEALRRAGGGERIRVAPGRYPQAWDDRARRRTVTVTGPRDRSAVVAGLVIRGGQALDVSGLRFAAPVSVRHQETGSVGRRARDIRFHHDDFSAPGKAMCVEARSGVVGFSITDSHVHDCGTGFSAAAGGAVPQSRGLTISRNRFERFSVDAIQLGQWDDVEITRNVVREMRDPKRIAHNDGIQLTGNVRRITIASNRMSGSNGQLILIQDAVGPIDRVTVENNLVFGAAAVAIQSQGATRARFVHNTVWRGKDGGLWLTEGYDRGRSAPVVPVDTVVANNILSGFRRLGGAATAVDAGNVVAGDVGFLDVGADDYRLRATAPARGRGARIAGARRDIDGMPRSHTVPGAFR